MADVNISKTGVFIDTKTGQVVDSQPEEGVQLVAPGTEITPAAQRAIDDARTAAAGGVSAPDVVTAEPDGSVSSDAPVESGRKRR
jgi:hypothetical protein